MRLARIFFYALIRATAFVWVALNGGLFMHDHEARLMKIALSLACGMVAAALFLDFML